MKNTIKIIFIFLVGLSLNQALSKEVKDSSGPSSSKIMAMNSLDAIKSFSSNRLIHKSISIPKKKEITGFDGDMRFRYQQVVSDQGQGGFFLRARAGYKGLLNNNIGWTFRVASSGTMDPQSLGVTASEQAMGGIKGKPLWLDLASISYYVSDDLKLGIGKMENPYYSQEKYNLLWDEDLTFEGLSLLYSKNFSDKHRVNINGSLFLRDPAVPFLTKGAKHDLNSSFIQISSSKYNFKRYLGAASIEYIMNEEQFDFKAGIATYYMNAKGGWIGESDTQKYLQGNTIIDTNSAIPSHANDYGLLDVSLGIKFKDFWKPLSFSLQVLQNYMVQDDSFGFVAGGMVGDLNKKGFVFDYYLFLLQKDVTIARYTDSDVYGSGVGFNGHRASLSYFFNSNMRLKAQYIMRNDNNNSVDSDHILYASLSFNI